MSPRSGGISSGSMDSLMRVRSALECIPAIKVHQTNGSYGSMRTVQPGRAELEDAFLAVTANCRHTLACNRRTVGMRCSEDVTPLISRAAFCVG